MPSKSSIRPLPTQPIPQAAFPPPPPLPLPFPLLSRQLSLQRFIFPPSLSLLPHTLARLRPLPLPPNPHLQRRRRPRRPLLHRLAAIKPDQGALVRRLRIQFLLRPRPQGSQVFLFGSMAAVFGRSVGREQGRVVRVRGVAAKALLIEVVPGRSEGIGRGAPGGGGRIYGG